MAKAHTLVDTFADNALDAALWGPYGGGEREVNQRLEIGRRAASPTAAAATPRRTRTTSPAPR